MQEYTARVWVKPCPSPLRPFRKLRRYELPTVARSAADAAEDVYNSEAQPSLFGEPLVWVEVKAAGESAVNGDVDLYRQLVRLGEVDV